jgi:hypothetical protein
MAATRLHSTTSNGRAPGTSMPMQSSRRITSLPVTLTSGGPDLLANDDTKEIE